MLSVLIFILILSVLVLIHEFGHFIMAKRAGIGVEEFGFGLPPRIWGKKVGETIYSVNWLPFGGFVRLIGEDPTDARRDESNSYYVKTLKQRALVVVAGVFMNFMLAVVVFYFVLFVLGFKVSLPLLVDHNFKFVNESRQVLITNVAENSPAAQAGLESGDSIVSVDGKNIDSIGSLQEVVGGSGEKELGFTIENTTNNQTKTVTITPKYSEELGQPAIGIGLGEVAVLNYETLPQKLFAGFSHSYNTISYSNDVFRRLIAYSFTKRDITPISEGVSGPVGIASLTSEVVQLGPISVLQLVALLSLNLAVLNILPIPALDGGRFFFIIIEAVTRKKIYPNVEKWAHTIGFVLLIGLIVLITYNDIIKLLK